MAVFAACVYRMRSTPYFLLFSVRFGLEVHIQPTCHSSKTNAITNVHNIIIQKYMHNEAHC